MQEGQAGRVVEDESRVKGRKCGCVVRRHERTEQDRTFLKKKEERTSAPYCRLAVLDQTPGRPEDYGPNRWSVLGRAYHRVDSSTVDMAWHGLVKAEIARWVRACWYWCWCGRC